MMPTEQVQDLRDNIFDIYRELSRIREELTGLGCKGEDEYVRKAAMGLKGRMTIIDGELARRREENAHEG